MGLTSLVVAAALGAAPTYSAAVTRRVGLDLGAGLELAEMFSLALLRQGERAPGRRLSARALAAAAAAANNPDTAACAGDNGCVAVLGRIAGVDALFAMQLVKVGPIVICDVTLLRVADATPLASANRAVSFKSPAQDLLALAAEIVSRTPSVAEPASPLTPPPPPPVASVVSEPEAPQPPSPQGPNELGPSTAPPDAAVPPAPADGATSAVGALRAELEPEQPTATPVRFVAYGLGALALGSAAVGGYFGVAALNQAEGLHATDPVFSARQSGVLATARTADIAYLSALALAAGAIVVYLLTGPAAGASGVGRGPENR